ncbi:uncharacterized protein [Engystomops pustulosus]|uniref:uncharacterized protein n=1 Tax=Engystomops pustulosus TaxID=76066 RepID=UPI003AFA9336
MELSPNNSPQSPPDLDNHVTDTPRTSNLKFLRAKRLNYFCDKSSPNPLPKKKELQNGGKTSRILTPRKCHSAPTTNHIPADSSVSKKLNAEVKPLSLNGETSLEDKEKAKPGSSIQDVQANSGKEHLPNNPASQSESLPIIQSETKEHRKNSKTQTTEPCMLNKSFPNILHPTVSNPPVASSHHTLQPMMKEDSKDIAIQHGPKSESNVLFTDLDLQSSHGEPEIVVSPIHHNTLFTPQKIKDQNNLPHGLTKTESYEEDLLHSTHRSLLRSSCITDLDQDLLEDLSVPEIDKLHHVMTWAKKFLDKCNSDILSKNTDEDTSSEPNVNNGDSDVNLNVKSLEFGDFTRHPYLGDKPKETTPGQCRVPKSSRSLSKSKTTNLDSSMDNFFHSDTEDNLSARSNRVCPQLGKNSHIKKAFTMKSYADFGDQFFDNIKQDCIDLFENGHQPKQEHYNTHNDSKPSMVLKDYSINRENASSSPDSYLDTERLNSLLEDLELIEKGLEKNGEEDGSRTNRTFVVKKSVKHDPTTFMPMSENILHVTEPASHRNDSNRIYQECPACSFSSTTSSNWCAECGSALNSEKNKPNGSKILNLPTRHILDDTAVDDFFSVTNQRKNIDDNPKRKAKELGRAVCWESHSDVVSDSDSSVLDKYFYYVKQLDILKSQEKEKQTEHFPDLSTSETSSDDEDYSMPRIRRYPAKPWDDTKTPAADIYQLGDHSTKENNLKRSTEHNNGTVLSNVKSPLDRKLQKTPYSSSKVAGPRRYWEKSSIAWSSYTHGELKPRSHHSIRRPTSADSQKNKDQSQGDKDKGAVIEHLCRDKWERSTQYHQKTCEGKNGSMWLLLPDELWIYIFSLLSHGELAKVAQVCKRFRLVANDDSLWKVIKVTNCHSLKDSCLVSIGLHRPESISLYRCHDDAQNITDIGFRQLFQHCKDSLKELNITNCSGEIFKGDTVLFFANSYCTQLTSVDISWTGATDKGIISLIQTCTCLQSLSMNGCNITENSIMALLQTHCKSLVKLEIFGCHALTAKCLISVATECVNLEILNIGRIPKATDMCLAKIASDLHKITTLNLTGLNAVRDRAVHHIVKQCVKLENLTLSSCLQVTDVSLVEISTYRTTIKYLDLSGCKKVSDIGIQALARSCQQLRYLDLSSTRTGKRGVCLIASYCYTTLECLKLSFCKEITADAIEKLCKNCKRLKVLHLYGCRVSPDLGQIKKFSKSFQILHDLSIPTSNILGE